MATRTKKEVSWQDLDRHTFTFTEKQCADVIEAIVERATQDEPQRMERFGADRLRNGLLCAHREHPIRLIDLLNTCWADFPKEIYLGVLRHYDPVTDTIRDGWKAQHSQPYNGW